MSYEKILLREKRVSNFKNWRGQRQNVVIFQLIIWEVTLDLKYISVSGYHWMKIEIRMHLHSKIQFDISEWKPIWILSLFFHDIIYVTIHVIIYIIIYATRCKHCDRKMTSSSTSTRSTRLIERYHRNIAFAEIIFGCVNLFIILYCQ